MAQTWWDVFRLWRYALGTNDPLSQRISSRMMTGAGIPQADAIPDIRQDGSFWGGSRGMIPVRGSNDFIDLSSVTNRQSRYKEYERLRNVAEIETAMTVFADEACLAGETPVSTLFYGDKPIQWLAENKADEEFLVYCWDFAKKDYTLGWAFNPRKTKEEETIKVVLDDGSYFISTKDHRILMREGEWRMAGQLKFGDELMPFYRTPANTNLTNLKVNQFPRVFTFDGWKHERQFMDEWKAGGPNDRQEKTNKAARLLAGGLTTAQIAKEMDASWGTVENCVRKAGFSAKELKFLGKNKDRRRVLGILPNGKIPVYDLSVKGHENFCGQSCVFHNCQTNDEGHVLKIECESKDVKKELEFLLFNRGMINLDRRIWNWAKNLFIFGDLFVELKIDEEDPKSGVQGAVMLPPESMYRIETTKGRLIEFQQSKEGPDYESLTRNEITQATDQELRQSTAIRFEPNSILHARIGDDRKTFYPYGVSLIEAARGPAHQLRLMEDAMVVYRLCLTGDARVRTKLGWKYIRDIVKGDDIYCYDGECIPTTVAKKMCNGIKEVLKVKSEHVEITGTKTHPLLVNRNGVIEYVDLQDLKPGQDKLINVINENEELAQIPTIFGEKWAKLPTAERNKFKNSIYDKPKSQLMRECEAKYDRTKQFLYCAGKALPYQHALEICDKFNLDSSKLVVQSKGQINPERINLPKYVDSEFASLFGFLIGDGFVRTHQFGFTAGEDVTINEKYNNILKKYFGQVRFERDKRKEIKGDYVPGNYVVDSTTGCNILKAMGYIPGTNNKRVPSWAFNASKKIRVAFVEGYADADGHCRSLKSGLNTMEFASSNENLIKDIKELWHSVGLCSGIVRKRMRKGGHEIESGRTMPETISWELYASYRELPKYETIREVKYAGEQEVFDITVDNPLSNFIVNGIPSHNTRAPERRVFYVDVGTLPPFKAEAFMERIKDQFRKKKVSGKAGAGGASQVEEKWHAPAQDEDYWIPMRANSNTRVETLPGAQNLGEIDDAVYFRNKLFTAMNFPRNYFSNEDPNSTRITLSAQDVKFARQIERLQSSIEDIIWELCDRHLRLKGYPEKIYKDLHIKMTPPSDWREMSRAEVVTNRINNANALKGAQLFADFDIYVDWLRMSPEEAKEKLSRLKIQKLEDLKIQVLAQNPALLGVGIPGQGEPEVGAQPGGPNASMAPMDQGMGGPPPDMGGGGGPPAFASDEGPPSLDGAQGQQQQQPQQPQGNNAVALAEPTDSDLKKYDLEILNYSKEKDEEDIDYSEI